MSEGSISANELWRHASEGDVGARERLMALMEPRVQTLARKHCKNCELTGVEQAGRVGAADAITKYQRKGYKFETYAETRIRGAILDYVRRNLRRDARREKERVDEHGEPLPEDVSWDATLEDGTAFEERTYFHEE
jgi:RNA polymerase sigma factor FliA